MAVRFCVFIFCNLFQFICAISLCFFVFFVFVFLRFAVVLVLFFGRFFSDSTSLFLLFITVLVVRYMLSGLCVLLLTTLLYFAYMYGC